ncbi:TPA: MFS transporter [Enterobacter hormaechei]|uniref:MFS transporter n=1 Tax=Enterobacter hormaechei TaxID=158836 RepID=UPI000D6FBFA0|nr:MFS transporter [Enterobacter hormaechei]HAS0760117.1 MFS transporter [Enterobacter hormaechei subsp. xiangfangensis]EKS6331466.1 MFS transporter [Enterobacter hormaechei]EKS6509346.1 MFS transporter [Enterobacter hormaechei]EKT4031461.1 MFS transporter [Enterobacter hormaechei]EKZ1441398.1 MFS transporter [Enterobacter hormaechei]
MNSDNNISPRIDVEEIAQKPTQQRIYVLAILFISLSVIYLDRVNISIIAANTQFLQEMDLVGKPIYIGLLMSLFLITYGISNVVLSPIGDLIGPRKAMLIAYVIISLSLLLGGLSSIFGVLLGTRILLGVGEGLYYPMQNTFIKNWFPPRERGRANTAWILGQSLSPAVAMPVFTWIIAEYSWRHTFYFSFALSLIPLILIYLFATNTPRENKYINKHEIEIIEESRKPNNVVSNSSEKPSIITRSKIYLCNANFWMLLIIFSSNSMLSWGVVTWLPTYLNTERGFSWSNVGWMSSLPFIFGLLFKIASGIAVDRTGKKGIIMLISALLCAAGILAGVNITNNYIAAIMISFGIGASSMQLPCVFTLLQGMVPSEAISSAAGALNGMAVGFGALSPVLIGLILSLTHNFYSVMYLLIGIVLIGGLVSLLFAVRRL